MYIFLICGYGIPESIDTETDYSTYLKTALAHMREVAGGKEATIIPCGGPTNCHAPYTGTESSVIRAQLEILMSISNAAPVTAHWRIFEENQSLSTLENFVFAKRLIEEHGLAGDITIFCEATREERIQALAKEVFKGRTVHVVAVQFDTSDNKNVDPAKLQKENERATKEGIWTLERPERLERHHLLFEKKFEFLRKRDAEGVPHAEAVREWRERSIELVREIMPDHPLLPPSTSEEKHA